MLAQNGPEMLDLLFACGKLGAIFVPYNWRLTAAELEPLMADSQPGLVLCGPQCAAPDAVALADLQLEQYPDSPPEPVTVDLEDPWMILYTGGTTGRSLRRRRLRPHQVLDLRRGAMPPAGRRDILGQGVTFKTGYGMTEVGPNCFVLPDHETQRRAGSVGFPIFHAGTRLMVENRACGPGEVGELLSNRAEW